MFTTLNMASYIHLVLVAIVFDHTRQQSVALYGPTFDCRGSVVVCEMIKLCNVVNIASAGHKQWVLEEQV